MPSAWEQQHVRAQRVLLAVLSPQPDVLSGTWARAWGRLKLPVDSDRIWAGGLTPSMARNMVLRTMVQRGYGYLGLLAVDVVAPEDAFIRLVEANHPLVAGFYRRNLSPYGPSAYILKQGENGKQEKEAIRLDSFRWGQLVGVDLVPGGLTLIRRDLAAALLERYPRPFETTLDIDNPDGYEDIHMLSMRAKTLGVQPAIHTGVVAEQESVARLRQDGSVAIGVA